MSGSPSDQDAARPAQDAAAPPRQPVWATVRLCAVLLAVNCILRLGLAVTFPLWTDETYYWEWSRHPALGYPDHPPMVAWVMRLLTWVFGDGSSVALRLPSLLFGTGSLWLVHRLACLLYEDKRIAARSLVIVMGLPAFNAAGLLALPDGPVLFFHLLFLCLFVSAVRTGRTGRWLAAGLVLGLALLSKLTVVWTIAGCALFLAVSPSQRRWLRRPQPYAALLLALAVFSPYLYWDASHGWSAVPWQLWRRYLAEPRPSVARLAEFGFEQLANTSLFLPFHLAAALLVRPRRLPHRRRAPQVFLVCLVATVLVPFLVIGSAVQTHPHWTVLAYPLAAICLAAVSVSLPRHPCNGHLRGMALAGVIGLAAAACLCIVALPLLRRVPPGFADARFARGVAKAQHQFFGWKELDRELRRLQQRQPKPWSTLLFTEGHRDATRLSFERDGELVIDLQCHYAPGRAFRRAQAFYVPWEELAGKSGLFFTARQDAREARWRLWPLFDRVEELVPLTLSPQGGRRPKYLLFRVTGFRPPAEPAGGGGPARRRGP